MHEKHIIITFSIGTLACMKDIIMGKISIVGAFGKGLILLNGQTVKTKIIAKEFEKQYGISNVSCIDTYGLLNNFLSLIKCVLSFFNSENIIILPAHNALKVLAPWLNFWNFFFHKRLHYVVIGGWLDGYLNKNPIVEKALRSFTGIYVETHTMMLNLQKRGFTNIVVMPNCKDVEKQEESRLVYSQKEPFRLVTFSRVMRQKGIEDVARVVFEINEEVGRRVFELDIYGQVDKLEMEWFESLSVKYQLTEASSAIKYKGCVPFDESVRVLSEYFALLFPTRFFTEGIPGTIIDSYAAGVPVISARWESFADVIDEGMTGVGFEFENWNELKNILLKIAAKPDVVNMMRQNCLKKVDDFLPSKVILKIRL